MRLYFLSLLTLCLSQPIFGQSHTINALGPYTINVGELETEDDYFPYIHYLGVPDGNGRAQYRLAEIKKEVEATFPKQRTNTLELRGGAPPQILDTFAGIPGSLGIPLDNHLAVSNDGHVVAVANFNLVVYKDGELLKASSLIRLTRHLQLPAFRFDPRIIYDPVEDRFCLTMLHGTNRDQTDIIMAFSQTSDPTGDWNFYIVPGNPFNQTIFSDYPMLSLTPDHLYLTINAVDDELSWQEGFVETYIWQMDKFQGYAGDSLTPTLINEIKWNDKPIRNLCPITSGDENLPTTPYFLSNRNFDIQNDTVFLVKYENDEITVRPIIVDTPYGVPPNADQGSNDLQTNDARILDAFVQDGHVQFVGNCVNPDNGLAAFYHGIIEDIEQSNTATGQIITDGDNELGYPDISYAGTGPGDRHSLIVVSHVALDRFPGISVLEYNGLEHSPLQSLKEGSNYITRLGGQVERWGDYSGNQRIYNQPGVAWVNSSIGRISREYGIWIGHIARSDINVATKDVKDPVVDSKVWPNPAFEWATIEFTPPSRDDVRLFNCRSVG